MTADRMEDYEAFVAIVEHGSQTAAAKQLRRSLQSISRSLGALERSIGIELVSRSTRRSGATEAGLEFYRRLKPALREIGDAKLEIANIRGEPSGLLRVAAPVRFSSAFVVPVIREFMQRYPQTEVELRASDRSVNVHADGLDLAVRIRKLPDSALKARRLAELRIVAFGAPAYFAKHGRPKQPADLEKHQCIVRSTDPDAETWSFRVRGRPATVRVRGRFRSDDTAACETAAVQGLGIGIAPFWQVRPLVNEGLIQIILDEFESAKIPVFAVSPPTRMPLVKTRLFTDLLAAHLKRARL
jgi:DNA-binding transcriptional LysR family regulator